METGFQLNLLKKNNAKKSPISLALIAPIAILLWWDCSLLWSDNYFNASHDIKNGNIKFITYGFPMPSSKDSEIKMIMNKYGFKDSKLVV